MFEVKSFDDWIEDDESGKFGSGASEKIWLINPKSKEKGLLKFPKIKSNGDITGEYYAEKLASELALLLGIRCAKVDLGIYKGRKCSMSYNLVGTNELLNEGINYIQEKYPNYDMDEFIDVIENSKYNVQMLEKLNIKINDILTMMIFDALIGNSDRHHSNWGYIYHLDFKNGMYNYFCPLYDNGSSLCSYVNEEDINVILKDRVRYNSLIDTKSKSCIGWDNERPIRHFELLKKIKENYYDSTIKLVMNIKCNITENAVQDILDKFDNDIISIDRKKLLLKFIIDRRNKIVEIYNLSEEVINCE